MKSLNTYVELLGRCNVVTLLYLPRWHGTERMGVGKWFTVVSIKDDIFRWTESSYFICHNSVLFPPSNSDCCMALLRCTAMLEALRISANWFHQHYRTKEV